MKNEVLVVLLATFAFAAAKFPKGFSFGAATSALQIEGAWLTDNKSFTVWDNLARVIGRVKDNSTTEHTCNSFYMYDRDIAIMKEYGIKHYRLSIQWTRIMPLARAGTFINQKAVEYYRRVLTALRNAGIESYVNLYHNDMPAVLFIEGTGRTDPEFPMHFGYYADQCFRLFGDLVNYWFTFDEPWCQSIGGKYEKHEVGTKPYNIGYEMILAHAEAAHIYKTKYQKIQHGQIGINLNIEMFWPLDPNSKANRDAAARSLMFQVGWFWNPIMNGDYPEIMKKIVGDRLPRFTDEQKMKVKGSADFLALNHYYSWVSKDGYNETVGDYYSDVNSTNTHRPEWKKSDIGFSIVPQGIHDLLIFMQENWMKNSSMPIFITENGVSVSEPTIPSALNDIERIDFLSSYLTAIEQAIKEGVNIKKYFVWSLIDNFEWNSGLSSRFGLTRIEYADGYKRIPKASLKWYSELIKSVQ